MEGHEKVTRRDSTWWVDPLCLQFADSPRVVARCDWYIYGREKNAFVGFQRRILTDKMVSILHTVIQQALLTTRRRA